MARKVTNRRVGPKNREHPAGKHKSLLQDVTYSDSLDHPMGDDERARMKKDFSNMGAITKPYDLPTLLEKHRTIAIAYLDDSGIEYKECDGWEWGHTLTDEYKVAAQLDGGFVAAFKVLNTAKQVENKLKKGDLEKAIAYSLHLGLYTRQIVKAEMEAMYHAGIAKTGAANALKSREKAEAMSLAKPIYLEQLGIYKKKHGWPNATYAAGKTAAKLLADYNIKRAPSTIRDWFQNLK